MLFVSSPARRKKNFSAIAFVVAASALFGVSKRAHAQAPALRVPAERYRLPNGLTVILSEDHSVPQVAVNIWYRVGSKDERPGRTGFAHLFEHLMFMGTSRVPNGRFDAIMESAGGQNNASTSEDRTNYYETGPSTLLETFLFLEANRLATLADDMTAEKVDLQRDVVKNERRQSYENRPYGRVELVLPERMFPAGHPYHHPVIGSHEDLTAATASDVKQFFQTFYVPANAQLAIVGDFHAAEARRLVEKYFGPLETRPEPQHAQPPAARLAASEKVTITDRVELARATLAWHSPAAFQSGDAAAELLAAVLGGGKASRLYRALVYHRKIAQAVDVEQRGMRGGGLFVVAVTAQPGHGAPELTRALDEELGRLATVPLGVAELERARAIVETQLLRGAEKLATRADLLNTFELYFGDPGALEKKLLARYDEVTLDELSARARTIFGLATAATGGPATAAAPRLVIEVLPEKPATVSGGAAGGGR